jgi:hypothetical protein
VLLYPSYTLNFTSSNYHLFKAWKKHVKRHHHEDDRDKNPFVACEVMEQMSNALGSLKVMQHWQKSMDSLDFVEK